MAGDRILEFLRRPVDVDEHFEIRELRKARSTTEGSRDRPGLIATLREDRLCEVGSTGVRQGSLARKSKGEMMSPDLTLGGSA